MRISIMQPYIFPYIGYWQLINATEKFVILDDVNYIVRGYINRNYILVNGVPWRFTIPVKKASQNKLIMEMEADFTWDKKQHFLTTIYHAYKKAPNFSKVMPLVQDIVNNEEPNLTAFIKFSIEQIMGYLGIHTALFLSSNIEKPRGLKGEQRIIEICKKMGADTYINPCGGRGLYNKENFGKENLNLYFLDTCSEEIVYNQNQGVFTSNLSILDVLFFNDVDRVRFFLEKYNLNEN